MTDDPRFDERQVALILRRTAELQRAQDLSADASLRPVAPGGSDGGNGLSLAQLEQVAAEAGIDPALVRRAAADLRAADEHPRNWFLGDAVHVIVERTARGEVAPEQLDRVLEFMRLQTGDLGDVSVTGHSCGWKGRIDRAKSQVSVHPDNGRTVVRVQVDLDEVAVGEFMMFSVGVGGVSSFMIVGATIATLGGAGAFLAAAPAAIAGYALGRLRYTRTAARMRTRATAIADAIVERIEQLSRAPAH